MKKCEYCGRELDSYHLMYCRDSDCEQRAERFYETRKKTEMGFGIVNVACVVLIMIGLIMAVFSPVIGNIVVAAALVVLGIVILIMPYAPESFYKKWRIRKTSMIVRGFGIVCFLAAVGFTVLAMYYNANPK